MLALHLSPHALSLAHSGGVSGGQRRPFPYWVTDSTRQILPRFLSSLPSLHAVQSFNPAWFPEDGFQPREHPDTPTLPVFEAYMNQAGKSPLRHQLISVSRWVWRTPLPGLSVPNTTVLAARSSDPSCRFGWVRVQTPLYCSPNLGRGGTQAVPGAEPCCVQPLHCPVKRDGL